MEIIEKEYNRLFEENKDLNEVIGFLKGKYKNIAQVKKCTRFKNLSQADKEYVLDELKADGFR
jgi:cell division septum initiation protein DivIVA